MALKHLNSASSSNRTHARWIIYLQKFHFSIKHRPGQNNKVVDTLSKKDNFLTILRTQIADFDRLKSMYATKSDFSEWWEKCREGATTQGFCIQEGFLFCYNKLCILVVP